MMGTAKYLSPEQVRGKQARRSRRPVLARPRALRVPRRAGAVPRRDRRRHRARPACNATPPTSPALRPTLPYGLASLIHELLARNPDDRPATGGELRARLARIASGVDDPTTTITPPRGTTSPPGAVAAASPTPATPSTLAPTPVMTASSSADGTPTRHSTSQALIRPPGDTRNTPRRGAARPINAPPPPTRNAHPPVVCRRGVPARQFQQSRTPSIVVLGLLVVAAIVAAITAVRWRFTGSSPTPTVTTSPTVGAGVSTTAAPRAGRDRRHRQLRPG